MSQFERVLVNIREKCHLDSSAVDAEEWSTFQNSLRIIQTCGNLPDLTSLHGDCTHISCSRRRDQIKFWPNALPRP